MRELRGAIIDESASAGPPPDAIEVEAARATLQVTLSHLRESAIQFHEDSAAQNAEASQPSGQSASPKPIHAAICVPPGLGKSELARQAAAEFIIKAKAKGIPHRVLFMVPTHRLGEEARQRVPQGVRTALWQSRKAKDVTTGEPLCLNLAAVEAAEAIGADVERTACRKGRRGFEPIKCPFYDVCRYQAQKKSAKKADVTFLAHEYLFAPPKELRKNLGLVFVDEGFWQSGLWHSRIAVDGLDAELQTFPVRDRGEQKNVDDTGHLADLIARLQLALNATPDGEYVTKKALLAAGLLAGDQYEDGSGTRAAKYEWRRKVEVDVTPESSEEVRKAVAQQYRFLGQLPRRAAMWRYVEEALSAVTDATGRLRTEMKTTKEGSVLYLRLNGRREIHREVSELPVVLLDATLNLEIVRWYFPNVELTLDLKVQAPNQHVTQVLGLPVGKSSLLGLEPGKRSPDEEARVGRKRDRLLSVVRKISAGRRSVLITYKELEPAFQNAGRNVELAHFNAVEGIDRWREVECLITVGRPLPAPKVIEDIAAALTGKPVVLPIHPARRPGGQPQSMVLQDRTVRLENGAEYTLSCRVFDGPEAELIRQAVTEAALVQSIGRARGVNRSAANKVEVWMILHDTIVPVAIRSVAEFRNLEPNKIDLMIERGLVPAWSADAAKLYPDLWSTAQAARKAYSRDGLDVMRNRRRSVTEPDKESGPGTKPRSVTSPLIYITVRACHTPLVRYQPKGRGQKPRIAQVDASMLAEARARIETAVGELASFEVITDEAQLHARPEVRWSHLIWGAPGSCLAARCSDRDDRRSSSPRRRAKSLRLPLRVTPNWMATACE